MNRATLQATVFENRPQGDKTYGYRIYDDYANAYNNILESIPDDDLELLTIAIDSEDPVIVGIIESCLENQDGLYIGDEWYGWDQIKHLFTESNSDG